jgi:hypothetical protein
MNDRTIHFALVLTLAFNIPADFTVTFGSDMVSLEWLDQELQ